MSLGATVGVGAAGSQGSSGCRDRSRRHPKRLRL